MPIYEYECRKCGQFEVTQRITEDPLSRCPTCRGKVAKLISHTSFQLKGTGWYATDYGRKDGRGDGAGKESKPEAKTDSKSGSTPQKSDAQAGAKTSKSKEAAAA
ncbi:MAG: FmdB family zinc ribbon protein [Candidatus Binatia bacterium]